jgi:hypothetical protein
MADWRDEIRARVASLHLPPERERSIVDELSQHVEDHCRELIDAGLSEATRHEPRWPDSIGMTSRSGCRRRRIATRTIGAALSPARSSRTSGTPRGCCAGTPGSPPSPS